MEYVNNELSSCDYGIFRISHKQRVAQNSWILDSWYQQQSPQQQHHRRRHHQPRDHIPNFKLLNLLQFSSSSSQSVIDLLSFEFSFEIVLVWNYCIDLFENENPFFNQNLWINFYLYMINVPEILALHSIKDDFYRKYCI